MSCVRLVLVVVATLGLGCGEDRGGEGQGCKSTGILGSWFCDQGLVCNAGLASPTCEKPRIHAAGDMCSSDQSCAEGLWCAVTVCAPFLKEGEPCPQGAGCGPGLTCHKDAAAMTITCRRG